MYNKYYKLGFCMRIIDTVYGFLSIKFTTLVFGYKLYFLKPLWDIHHSVRKKYARYIENNFPSVYDGIEE